MSRLAHLVTQLAQSADTQDKLATTYFRPAQPSLTPPPAVRVDRRGIVMCTVGAAVLGVCVGWLLHAAWASAAARPSLVNTSEHAVLTFDEPTAWDLFGRHFGLWWSAPSATGQWLHLALDADTRVGASGQSLRMDYALAASAGRSSPVGVWFALPASARASPADLEFMIRADGPAGHAQRALLELSSGADTKQRPLAIGPEWTAIRVPLARQADAHGRAPAWQEFRILLDREPEATRGRLYIDHIRLVTRTR